MNNIEIVVEDFESYKRYEQWLFGTTFFEYVEINIFCIATTETYFYETQKVGDNWLVVTAGETFNGEKWFK